MSVRFELLAIHIPYTFSGKINRMFKLLLRKFLTVFSLTFIIIAFFVLANVYTYKRFTNEKPIAQLSFTPIQAQAFNASIRLGDECEGKEYRLYGDEWRIDAQFLKWKSWATLFGVDAMYRIDRLSGRYLNIEDENAKLHIAHDLQPPSTLNLNKLAERYDNNFPPVDTVYGSSAYEKMKPDILFTVYRTQTGILIREENLLDSKNDNCIKRKSVWKNFILKTDQKFVELFNSI